MTFSNYIKKLYPYCGNGKSPSDFIISLLTEATTEQNDPIFDKSSDYMKRIFNGTKHIGQRSASYLLTHIDKEYLDNMFLNDIPSEDALVELCGVFEPAIGNSTVDNIATKLSALLVSILKTIAQGKKAKMFPIKKTETDINDTNDIEDALSKLVKKLASLSQQEVDEILLYEPLTVDKKIEQSEVLLKKEIRHNVAQYYVLIEDLLKQTSVTDSVFIDRLLKNVQRASNRYIEQGLTQQQVFTEMVQWLKGKTTSTNDIPCRIMVSFFVQNCEVFYEITE